MHIAPYLKSIRDCNRILNAFQVRYFICSEFCAADDLLCVVILEVFEPGAISYLVNHYEGRVDDELFEGGSAERHPLKLGSDTFIPGFEDQLVGVVKGEEKDVVVTFPEDYHADDLAGKEAVFKCKVHEIKELEMPEIDDDFVKDVSEFDTMDELKADTKEKLIKARTETAENRMKNSASAVTIIQDPANPQNRCIMTKTTVKIDI